MSGRCLLRCASLTCYTCSVTSVLGVRPMKRRAFITLLGGAAAAWPLAARAQTAARALIVFLAAGSKAANTRFYGGFPEGMRELGYLENRDYMFEARYADGDGAHLPA